MKINETIYDISTDKITEIEREMTQQEIVEYQEGQALLALEAEAKAKAAAKKAAAEAKLAALGLTAEDLKALGLG